MDGIEGRLGTLIAEGIVIRVGTLRGFFFLVLLSVVIVLSAEGNFIRLCTAVCVVTLRKEMLSCLKTFFSFILGVCTFLAFLGTACTNLFAVGFFTIGDTEGVVVFATVGTLSVFIEEERLSLRGFTSVLVDVVSATGWVLVEGSSKKVCTNA